MSETMSTSGDTSSQEGNSAPSYDGYSSQNIRTNDINFSNEMNESSWDHLEQDWLHYGQEKFDHYDQDYDLSEWDDFEDPWQGEQLRRRFDRDFSSYDLDDYELDDFDINGSDLNGFEDFIQDYNNMTPDELDAYMQALDAVFQDDEIETDEDENTHEALHPDTEEVTEYIMEELGATILTQAADISLDEAQERYGEEFDEAFYCIVNSGNSEIAQYILSQENPGEELIRVFRRAQMLTEIPDGDLERWTQERVSSQIEEMLSEFWKNQNFEAHERPATTFPPPSILHAPGTSNPFRENIPFNAVSFAFGN